MERLGYEFAAMLVTLFYISEISINLTKDLFLISRGKKKLTKFVYVSSIIPSFLKLAKLHRSFYKFMFSEDGLKCRPKRRKVFLRKHGFVEKNVLFCQFKFVYFLETTMNEWLIFWINMMICINLVVNYVLFWLRLCQGDFDRPKQNLSRQ